MSRPAHPVPAARDARPTRSIGASASVSWAGMALPLVACAAIWGIGDASPVGVAWLSVVHGVIGTAASAWTALRLILRRRVPRGPRKAAPSWPGTGLLLLYGLLALQPVLAVAASMLHGDAATLFGIPLPSILSADPWTALQVDRLHGANALLVLGLIAMHVWSALRSLRYQRSAP